MSIKIPVSADFDGSQVEAQLQAFRQQLNALGAQIAQANKVQFNPVGKASLDDMRKMIGQFEALKRVSGDLNKRVNATGQKGAGFFDLDWSKMYPDQASRARQMAKAFQYVTGSQFGRLEPVGPGGRPPPPVAPPPQPPRNPGGGGPSWTQTGGGIVQAGLRATGPVGGVAAGALGTGMSAGFGAGLMGLLGGIGALGVGKLVGMATEKMGQAEDNLVAYDKLKRVLGDVNVSFTGLKTVLEGAASGVKVTFDEAARLGTQFAKLGNLSNDQYGSLDGELRTGVGMSRSLGLDPSQGMNFLGTMRGMRQTQDEQGSRKMALLIGETIAKSDAFAKSDEVMEAISGYVTAQTRMSLGANASGFAGLFSSMVGSGIPGLDPAGASNLINKLNASLSAGGAKGEASQFFTAKVGRGMGLDSLRTQLLRESGAFATNDQVFGRGSIYERSTGLTGPTGNTTFYGATMARLKQEYTGNDPDSKLLRANAAGNHLGISMTQALALDGMGENQMGELESQLKNAGVKIGDMNFAGLGSLSKVFSGSSADRLGVASELWARTGKDKLSAEESSKLDNVMRTGSEQEQKEILSQLIASRDQEMTQGKDIRDTKVGVDNIKTVLAEQLLPVTQAMRDGIMWMAGGKDGKSSLQVREDLAKVENNEKYSSLINQQDQRIVDARMSELGGDGSFEDTQKRLDDSRRIQAEANEEIARLTKEKESVLAKELEKLRATPAPEVVAGPGRAVPEGWRAPGSTSRTVTPGAGGPAVPLGEAPASVINPDGKMTRGYRNNNPGNLEASINWRGMTGSDGRFAQFSSPADGYRAMGSNLMAYNKKYGINTIRGIINRWAPPGENDTGAYIARMSKELGVGPDDALDMKDQETLTRLIRGISKHENGYQRHDDDTIRGAAGSALGREGTPLPEGAKPGSQEQRFKIETTPLEVIHKNARGEQVGPSQQLATRVRPPQPFGANRDYA